MINKIFRIVRTAKKTELSLYVDGSRIICEQYGDIKNAKKYCFSAMAFLDQIGLFGYAII